MKNYFNETGEASCLQRSAAPKKLEISKNNNNGFPWSHPDYRSHMQANVNSTTEIDFQKIDEFLSSRKITPLPASRYAQMKKIISLTQKENSTDDEIKIHLNKFQHSTIDYVQIKAIVENYTHLKKIPKNLHTAFFKDSIIPSGNSSPGRDFLFEHYVGARFSTAGCLVKKDGPDFICSFENIKFGVAIKKIKISRLRERISDAKKQIYKSGLPGVIALDLSSDFIDLNDFPFYGNYDEYIKNVHTWMEINFYQKLRENYKIWNLDGRTIPNIIAFNIGAFFNLEKDEWTLCPHLSILNIPPANTPTEKEYYLISSIHKSLEKIRLTLVDAD